MSDKPAWMQELSPVDPGHLERLYNQRIAALRAVDDLIGTVVQALRDTRRLRNTAFLFTSDNGYLLGQHRWQTKVLVYEESIRVPLAIRVPGLRGPATMSAMVLNNDLAPTITALAGVSPDPGHVMDGRSLLPLLDGTAPRWRQRILLDFAPPPQSSSAPSGEDWDLKGENPLAFDIPAYQAVRTGATGDRLSSLVYSEVMDGSGDTELYDLKAGLDGFADPLECRSLHRDPSDLRVWQRQQLKQQLDALRTCGQGTCQLFEEE
jgi:hypothetical protein